MSSLDSGDHPHPSWQLYLETIIISQCGLFDANSSGQFYPLNSLNTMFPKEMAKPQRAWQCHALRASRSEVLGLPAREKKKKLLCPNSIPNKQNYCLQRISQLGQWAFTHLPCGQKQRLLLEVLDYIRTSGLYAILEDGVVRDFQ